MRGLWSRRLGRRRRRSRRGRRCLRDRRRLALHRHRSARRRHLRDGHGHVVRLDGGGLGRDGLRRRSRLRGHDAIEGVRAADRLEGLADLRFEGAQLGVLGRHRAQSLERHPRADQVAELPPRDEPRLRQEERAPAVVRASRGLFGDGQHPIPVAPLLSVRLAQEEEGALVRGVELEGLLEEAGADVDVLVAQDPPGPERERERSPTLAVGRLLQDLVLRLLEDVEPALLRQEPLVEGRDLTIQTVRRVGTAKHPFRLFRSEPPSDARSADEDAGLGDRIAGLVRRAQQPRQVLLPVRRLDLHVGQAATGLRVARGHPDAARVRRRRLLPVALVAEDIPQLQQKRARALTGGAGLQLELEQLLDHVQLAEVPVDVAGSLEALGQRRVELVRVLKVLQRLHAGEELRLEDAPELQVKLRLRGVGR